MLADLIDTFTAEWWLFMGALIVGALLGYVAGHHDCLHSLSQRSAR